MQNNVIVFCCCSKASEKITLKMKRYILAYGFRDFSPGLSCFWVCGETERAQLSRAIHFMAFRKDREREREREREEPKYCLRA
jgi:hypothetical protein